MSPPKKSNSLPLLPGPLGRAIAFLGGPGRTFTLLVVLVVLTLVAWYFVWQEVKSHVLNSSEYTVTLEQVHITPLPPWIHADVRADVFRNASLDPPLSILDDELPQRISNAFVMHPWVAKVNRVVKRPPAQIDVDLVYRRPICMVEVPGDLLPVDIEGVLLPSGDFSPIEKQAYPCLAGIDSRPLGPVGQRWGDGRIVDGAEIAAALESSWKQLRLFRIQPCPRLAPAVPGEPTYELFTRAGTRIYWGLAPSSKATGELTTAERVARLQRYAAEHGSLDGHEGPQTLDVRNLPPTPGPAVPTP